MAKKRRFGRARRYYHRAKGRAAKMTIPLAPAAGLVAMPAVGQVITDIMTGQYQNIAPHLGQIAGIPVGSGGKFDRNVLQAQWTPFAAGMLVHIAASKLGVNRMLGRAKIPIVRV